MTMDAQDSDRYDLCVIGCGAGGFAAAMRAFDLGKQVCILEPGEIGGAGVMWGALASKTMWELSKDYAVAAKTDRGYRASGLGVDYLALRDTVIQAVKEKQYQMLSQIESFSPRRWKGPGSLTLKRGRGAFVGPETVRVSYENGRFEDIGADYFLLATGSDPRQFPGIPTDQLRILDSDGVLNLRAFPKRLMIIGAGIIGCEYATIFSNFGQTEVWLVDHQKRVIPYEDADVSDFVSRSLARQGVNILHSADLKTIRKQKRYLEAVLDFADGHSRVVEVDAVLIAIGRVSALGRLGLDHLGVDSSQPGPLQTDPYCRITPRVYGAGDITHHPALVNMAEMEGRYAVEHMFGLTDAPLRYTNMSTVMFFHPAVAAVGLNEKSCRKKGIPYKVAWYSNALVSRAIIMRALNGFVKILISDDGENRILGMRAAGPQVSSTIVTMAHFMDEHKGIADALRSLYPHPTISEGIQEALRLLLGHSLYKPHAFPEHIRIRSWRPEK